MASFIRVTQELCAPYQMWSRGRCSPLDGEESRGPQNVSSHQVDARVTRVEGAAGQEQSPPHESSMKWPEAVTPSLPLSQFKPSFQTEVLRKTSMPLGRRLQTPPSVNLTLSTLFQHRVSTARTVTALPQKAVVF